MAVLGVCSIAGCGKKVICRGFCSMHYSRWRIHGDPLGGKAYGAPLLFYRDVVLPCRSDNCLWWPFSTGGRSGRAQIWYDSRLHLVSRLACAAIHGPPPTPKHEAAHNCGNGHLSCVNPMHLRWATHVDNHADRIFHGSHKRGERTWNAKLTAEDVREIRGLKGQLSGSQIARRYGVAMQTINDILRRKNWAWLD